MNKHLGGVLILVIAVATATAPAGCGGKDDKGGASAGGTGGSAGAGGSSGDTGGSGGSVVTPPGAGGAPAGEGPDAAASGGSGGSAEDAGPPPPATADGGSAPAGDAAPAGVGHAGSLGWYEAETALVTGRATKPKCTPCPSSAAMKPGDQCCSGGGQVDWLVAHGNGEVQFNNVSAPADGMYDVTWWYYCGKNDNFGDKNCGGQTMPPTTAAGCRPHQFYVNGTLLPGAYHFPCFAGAWSVVRVATVTMPLKAGAANTIKLHAPPPRDSVNVDAIELYPAGKGMEPLIKSVPDLTGH
jgi:hypothetical protein